MKRTHIIIQTGYVDFFNYLTWKSSAMLSLCNKHDNFVIICLVKQMFDIEKELKAHGFTNVKSIDLVDFQHCTLGYIDDVLSEMLESYVNIHTLNIFNGACNSLLENEEKHHTAFEQLTAQQMYARLGSVTESVYQSVMFILYDLIKLVDSFYAIDGFQINNFVEDPLQHKLHYLRLMHPISHRYFHRLKDEDNIYRHPLSADSILTRSSQFVVSPSQQFYYMHGKSFDGINAYRQRKHLTFAFAMTNVWKDKQDRTILINKLEHIHNKESVNDGIVFRYFSRDRSQQHKSDKLLPYDTYLELIKSSKFTLIIPSYDSECFSMRRFFESIAYGCIPLVHESCELYMFNKRTQQFIKQHLLVDEAKLKDFKSYINDIDTYYDELLELLFRQPFVHRYTKTNLYRSELKQCKLL